MHKKVLSIIIITVAATLAITIALTMNTVIIKQAFASGGGCSSCATSVTPHTLSSGLSGTGAHGVEKIFAPGQEAQASDVSASSFSPGHEKP